MIDLNFNKEVQRALKSLKSIVGKDDLRPSLSYVAFRDGYLYAIGEKAMSLIRVPLVFYGFSEEDVNILNGKYLHIDELSELVACESIEVRATELLGRRGTRKILCDFTELSDYPAVESVFPSKENSRGNMTINARVLSSLASAFVATRRIVAQDCYSEGDKTPVLVVPLYGDGTFPSDEGNEREQEAVIMPFAKEL